MHHLENGEVGRHRLVVEELALGRIDDRESFLASLAVLEPFPMLSHVELLAFVEAHRLWGGGLSPTDAHLLGAVRIVPGGRLWARDKRLRGAAQEVGVPLVEG
ncbi:VapC toxin family PIN domain ribonuclease [Nocardioides sp. KR10-350]|uniref:VapC toxin family PIN domain ribonuclease n=1 Tax=Nocardioides cheoyonin TaxID=3156615 RepID=UPI0032B57459